MASKAIFAKPAYVNGSPATVPSSSSTSLRKTNSPSPSISTPMRMAFLVIILIMNSILLYMWIAYALPSRILWYAFAASMGIIAGTVLFFGGGVQGRATQLLNALIFIAPFISVILFETYVANTHTDRGTALHKRKASRIAGIAVVSACITAVLIVLTSTRAKSPGKALVGLEAAVQDIGLGILV